MSKELEALERIKNAPTIYVGCASDIYTRYSFECKLIETALKDYENLKQENEMLIGFGGHFFDESFKQNKVLEIIKDRFSIQFSKSDLPNYYGIMQIGTNPIYIKTKEEYDLLKEVLL